MRNSLWIPDWPFRGDIQLWTSGIWRIRRDNPYTRPLFSIVLTSVWQLLTSILAGKRNSKLFSRMILIHVFFTINGPYSLVTLADKPASDERKEILMEVL
jgi:hypothetical protein